MKPWEIAARVCRPMSTEEALRLTSMAQDFREFGDADPEVESMLRSSAQDPEGSERVPSAGESPA